MGFKKPVMIDTEEVILLNMAKNIREIYLSEAEPVVKDRALSACVERGMMMIDIGKGLR